MAVESDSDYLIRRISPGETLDGLTSFPRYFEIETVNACNAACPFCTIADWNRKDGVMKDDLFEKIAAELEEHAAEVRRVHLYRDGEPLLDKKLPRRIKRLKEAGIREIGISTNAELLDEARASKILEAGLDEIIISIDSVHEEIYKKLRVGLDFLTVLTNSKLLFNWRNRWNPNCRIRIRMIRQDSNRAEWESGEFQRQWEGLVGLRDTIEFREIHNWGGQLAGHAFQGETVKPCLALWSLCCIFADGTMPLCNVDYNAKYPVGNVRASTIAALWQSSEQNKRRQLHMSGNRAAIPPCTNCTVWSENVAGAA